jgi:pimeloyl-ACP methyl ester carboxylesterase
MPSLVITGMGTRGFYRLIGEVTAAGIPSARLVRLPDCGHMTIVEVPDAVSTLLGDFLTGVARV